MDKRYTIETVDRRFRDIMDKDNSFGSNIMVFGGDFRKFLPETINASLVRSYLSPLMEKM